MRGIFWIIVRLGDRYGRRKLISRLRLIADALSKTESIETAVQILALHACFSGGPSRVFLGRFSHNLELRNVVSFGFDGPQSTRQRYCDFVSSTLNPLAIINREITIKVHDEGYFQSFKNQNGISEDPTWQSTILMPLIPNFTLAISVQRKLESDQVTIDYFNAIFAIFNLFLRSHESEIESGNEIITKLRNRSSMAELTERQSLILEMIQTGNTNQMIAVRMGYSESLIRQETINIYRKLGISGRRDLIINTD
jgi:DNA-binding CsgD family transcriptional regulator